MTEAPLNLVWLLLSQSVRFMALVTTYSFTPPASAFSHGEPEDTKSTSTARNNETNDIPPMHQPNTVFPYDEEDDIDTNQSYLVNGDLFCYKCGAYQNDEDVDFDSALDDCMFKPAETAESEKCPNTVVNITKSPSCSVNKMMAAGHITSFTRGCMIYHKCIPVDYCETSLNKTGACQSCCREDYCNRAAGECLPRVQVFKLLVLTLSTYFLFVR